MLYKVQIALKLYFNLIFARLKSCIVQLSSLLSTVFLLHILQQILEILGKQFLNLSICHICMVKSVYFKNTYNVKQ